MNDNLSIISASSLATAFTCSKDAPLGLSEGSVASGSPRTSAAPFDKYGDLILRSADGVHFHVYRWILVAASPVFADMFAAPQPISHGMSSRTMRRREAMASRNTQHGNTLEKLLRAVYPCPPTLSYAFFDDIKPVAEAAHKYRLDYVTSALSPRLREFSRDEPVRVYAWAVRFSMDDIAERAARDFLRIPDSLLYADELADISGSSYHQLLEYRHRCRTAMAALSTTDLRTWHQETLGAWPWLTCNRCIGKSVKKNSGVPADCVPPYFRQHSPVWNSQSHALRRVYRGPCPPR
ncbi:hypothetical protein BV20DRAFT_996166 [Pilatotrama ljubarskyi]|nr:hypothetical protein BV20DRAFT_996166 [Pilatotrama ljubarskyi]